MGADLYSLKSEVANNEDKWTLPAESKILSLNLLSPESGTYVYEVMYKIPGIDSVTYYNEVSVILSAK